MLRLKLNMRRRPLRSSALPIIQGTLLLLCLPFVADLPSMEWEVSCPRIDFPRAASAPMLPLGLPVLSLGQHSTRLSDGTGPSLPLADLSELTSFFRYRLASGESMSVVIAANRETAYQRIDEVLGALQSARVRTVYFFTDPPTDADQ